MAIDYTTALGQLRLLISDADETAFILDDAQITGFLAMHGVDATASGTALTDVRRAAADALDAIASSESLVSKKIRTQAGVSTDGPAVAADLRKHAASLRALADESDDGGYVDVVEFSPYPVL